MGEKQTIDIPFSGGLRQKKAEPYLDGSEQATVTNAIWVKQNAVEKRPGWVSLPNTIRPTAMTWVPTHLAQTVGLYQAGQNYAVTDGTFLYVDAQVPGSLMWLDFVSPCVGTRKTISSSPNGVQNVEVAETNGVRCFVWEDAQTAGSSVGTGNEILYAFVNVATGEVFETGTVDRNVTGYQPKLIVRGTVISVFWAAGNASATPHQLYVNAVDTAGFGPLVNVGWGATQTVLIDFRNGSAWGGAWDVTALGGGTDTTHAFLIYESTSAAPSIKMTPMTLSGTSWSVASSGNIAPEASTGFRAIGARWQQTGTNTSVLWVAYAYGPSGGNTLVKVQCWSSTISGSSFSSLSNPVTIYTAATGTTFSTIAAIGVEDVDGGTNGCVVFSSDSTFDNPGIGWCRYLSAGALSAPIISQGLQLLSRPFAVKSTDVTYGARVYALVADTTDQPTQILVELDINAFTFEQGPRICATIAPRLASATFGTPGNTLPLIRKIGTLSSATNYANKAATLRVVAGTLTQTANIPSNLSAISCAFDFAHPARFLSTRLGGLEYLAGGLGGGTFDGVNMVESSTLYAIGADANNPLTGAAAGGHLTNGQTYTYVFVPEWRDDLGNLHQGQPSDPIQVAVPAGAGSVGEVSGKVLMLAMTQKGLEARQAVFGQGSMYIIPYRTAFLNGAMSTNLFRLVGDNPGLGFVNNQAALEFTFTDTTADASISANQLLYTTGGTLPNDAPSSFVAICTHQSRVYGIGDDLRTIWISTVQQDGAPCTFSDGAQVEVSFLGDLTAIWSMDDKLFVASATGIAYMTGSGPNAQGISSDLSPPQQIPSDVGVIDPRAVCVTPMGTVFRHAFGLGLLDRSLSVQSSFGDPVEDFLAASGGALVTGIQLHPKRPEVLVFLTTGGSGQILSFNYRFSAWSNFVIYDGGTAVPNKLPPVAALVVGTSVYVCDGSGAIVARECVQNDSVPYYDTVSTFSRWITLTITTGWVKPGGSLQGWGRFLEADVLFENLDWADMSMSFAYDYLDLVFSDPEVMPSALIGGFPEVSGNLNTTTRASFRPFQVRCSSVQIQIQDSDPGGGPFPPTTGQGFRIFGITANIENKGGIQRLPAGQGV